MDFGFFDLIRIRFSESVEKASFLISTTSLKVFHE